MGGCVSGMLAGVFVGGAARRFGGVAKGWLPTPDAPSILERWVQLLASLKIDVVLVGFNPAYAQTGLPVLVDIPSQIGPLGGLSALLEAANDRMALALACDMPKVSARLVERLCLESPSAGVLAPRRNGMWEPFLSRWKPPCTRSMVQRHIGEGKRSLRTLLDRCGTEILPLTPAESAELTDWDQPSDFSTSWTE